MVIFENSLVGGLLLRLWYVLCRWYEGSAVHRGLTALSRGWTRLFHGSAVMSLAEQPSLHGGGDGGQPAGRPAPLDLPEGKAGL